VEQLERPRQRPAAVTRLESVALPFWRTCAYLTPSAVRRRSRRFAAHEIPPPRPSASVFAHVAVDELTLAMFRLFREGPTTDALARISSEVDDATTEFRTNGWLVDPASYNPDPPAPTGTRIRPIRTPAGRLELLTFPSEWTPHPGEPGRDRWLSYGRNRIARAHVLRHPGDPRPWIVCLHGAGMGRPDADLWVLRARHLHHDLGCNVVLPVLALHGWRKPPSESGAQFPGLDVLDNIHGLAQSAWDVRRLLKWVRADGAPEIGLIGLSLGGYVAALVAGLEPALTCVVVGVPAVDFPRLLRHHVPRQVRELDEFRMLGMQSDRLHRVVSPLAVRPATPVARRFILGSTADRLLDPVHQTAALWKHWDRPRIHWMASGHVGHLWRRDTAAFVDDALIQSGLVSRS
jgi:pimeloyl-ACP methyl ester carboxylesterase